MLNFFSEKQYNYPGYCTVFLYLLDDRPELTELFLKRINYTALPDNDGWKVYSVILIVPMCENWHSQLNNGMSALVVVRISLFFDICDKCERIFTLGVMSHCTVFDNAHAGGGECKIHVFVMDIISLRGDSAVTLSLVNHE